MRTLLLAAGLALTRCGVPAPAYAGKVTLTAAAAATTIGTNVLGAPLTWEKTKAALKRTARVAKKAAKHVAGK